MIDPMEVLKYAPAIPTGLPTTTPSSVPTNSPIKPGPHEVHQEAGDVGKRTLW